MKSFITSGALCLGLLSGTAFAGGTGSLWPSAGHDLKNTHHQDNTSLKPKNVGQLQVKWEFTTGGDVSATPSVDENNIYFPDWGGNL